MQKNAGQKENQGNEKLTIRFVFHSNQKHVTVFLSVLSFHIYVTQMSKQLQYEPHVTLSAYVMAEVPASEQQIALYTSIDLKNGSIHF